MSNTSPCATACTSMSFLSSGSIGELRAGSAASADRCSLGPARGLEESELLALAANRDLQFTYNKKPTLEPIADAIKMEAASAGGPWLPLPATATQLFAQGFENSLLPSRRW